MFRSMRLVPAIALMLALSVAMQPTQAQVCPDDAIFAQGPADPNSAWIAAGSDAGASVLHYENFLVTGGQSICDIHWWGLFVYAPWEPCTETSLQFAITFYADFDGTPGTPTCTYYAIPTAIPTGQYYSDQPLWYFSVNALAPCCDTTYGWVSIQALGDDSCWFHWMSASSGDGRAFKYATGGDSGPVQYDLSICLTPAPLPAGACCLGSLCVPYTLQADCTLAGGTWQGANTTCEPNPCPQPSGACCFIDYSCSDLTASDCARFEGQWLGPDTTCAQNPCGSACAAWTEEDYGGPAAGVGHAMAYDAAREAVVLLGNEFDAETWLWSGSGWVSAAPATSPPPRSDHALAYDAARGVVVLFGGSYTFEYWQVLNDTWTWDGTTWTPQSPVHQPPARSGHTLAYDAARGVTVLFGGLDGLGVPLGDTWEWDGTDWTLRASSGPGPRYRAASAYDAERAVVVLFGGGTFATSYALGDTWEWNGATWSQRATSGPTPRLGHAMVYDPGRAGCVLFGGSGSAEMMSDETWVWDGAAWSQLFPVLRPTPRAGHALAFDAARAETVLFGGYNCYPNADTWTLVVEPAPLISQQPQNVAACEGETARFTVVAGRADALTYRWYRDGAPLSDGQHVEGATTDTLTIISSAAADAGSYTVRVANACAARTSAPATLTVATTTTITAQPQPVTVVAGNVVTFTVAATGTELTYAWFKGGQPLADGGRISGARTAMLTVHAATPANAGAYTVRVTGACGAQTSTAATLTVLPDRDGDGIPDTSDNCPDALNPDQRDSDGDGVGDVCDGCPGDANKLVPGACGCGTPDTDTDGDGVPDCVDNCPTQANADQADSDGDDIGDVCDDDQSERPKPEPADSAFIRGLIDFISADEGDSADREHFLDVLSDILRSLPGAEDPNDVSDANSPTDQSGRPDVAAALCPTTSALLFGLTLVGLSRVRRR